jgi:antitoxin component of MazEF toxin-antitoxin module
MQRLTRWGNSVGMRLPAAVLEAAGLRAGDYVRVRLLDSGEIRVQPTRLECQAEDEQLTPCLPECTVERW